MTRLIATAAILSVAGCSAHPGTSYTVRVDPGLTPAQTEAVLAAVSDWSAKVPVRLEVQMGDCPGLTDLEICVRASELDEILQITGDGARLAYTHVSSHVDGGIVYLDVWGIGSNDLQGITAHELGHAMGLEHWSSSVPLLMSAHSGTGWAHTVQVEDEQQWYSVRGMVAQ
jgi:predicted Zn-dependent protease